MRKTAATNNVVENLERTNVDCAVGAGSTFIIFINLVAPVLNLPIRSLSQSELPVKEQDVKNSGRGDNTGNAVRETQ